MSFIEYLMEQCRFWIILSKFSHLASATPNKAYNTYLSHFKFKKGKVVTTGSNMTPARKENVIHFKITKMYLPKYLLSCDRLLVVYTSDRFFVGYLERFISCASVKNVTGNYWLKT